MERCTDNRSTTPPLETMPIASKSKENGKQKFPLYLYDDKDDQVDIFHSMPMSSSEDAHYVSTTPPQPPLRASKSSVLCNYNSTSEDDSEVTESNLKSTSNRCESTKSSVINRKSEERKHQRERRRSRDSSARQKSRDRRAHQSASRQRNKDYYNRRRRSRSKKRYESSKDVPKELLKNREIRRTVTEPIIEYCENGRYPCSWKNRSNVEPKPKVRRVHNENDIDGISEQSIKNTTEPCSNSPHWKNDKPKNECSPPNKLTEQSNDDCFKSSTNENTKLIETKLRQRLESEDMFSCDTDYMPSNGRESMNTEQKTLNNQQQSTVSECDIKISNKSKSPSHESSDNMDVTSTTPETPKTPPSENKKLNEPTLSEDKMKQYIDEYDNFIQQVSSPLNETLKTNEITEDIAVANVEPTVNSISQKNESVSKTDLPKNEVSSSTSSAQKHEKKTDEQLSTSSSSSDDDDDDSSSSSNSSSSSSSDDEDSSSSSSGSSSSSSSDSNDNESSRRHRRQKSSSKSSSRSASKSPRLRPSKPSNIDVSKSIHSEARDMDFIVTENNKISHTNGIEALINPMTLGKVDMSALKSLDALINADDDDDLFSNIQSYKNNFLEVIKGKKQDKKSKFDEISSNDSTKDYKNGALLDDSERKKISLKLKPTPTLKQQTKGLNESFHDIEPHSPIPTQIETETVTQTPQTPVQPEQQRQLQEQQSQVQCHKAAEFDKQTTSNEHNDQIEKRSSDESMTSSSKRKSSHRRDERKSRRSEERKSRRSRDRSRSRHRRSRRSEERKNDKYSKRGDDRRSRRSEERRSRHSEERRSRRSEEKRSRRSEERRSKRRHDRSPSGQTHYRDSYYSPTYRNRSMSPLPRGPRTPPNTPPPTTTEFDEFRMDEMAMRQQMPPYGSTSIMPPAAHYHPGPNQFPPNMAPNGPPSYIHDYTAYVHPNRAPMPQQLHYNRPPPSINASALIPPPGMIQSPSIPSNNEFYYSATPPPTHHHLPNQSMPPNSYSNLIEVSPHGVPNSSNVDCVRKQQIDNRRKPTIAVQKGNVLEIVPCAEIQCDKNSETNNAEKSDKLLSVEKQALQRQKRKIERNQKRHERKQRKEYLTNELTRLSHHMTFASDGKVVKAGELLKGITFDGTTIKSANSKDDDENEDLEDIYIEPPVHSYDPQAPIGRSILSERNDPDRIPTKKDKRRGVLFADGVIPGEGTSAEESANENDDNIIKPKKLSSRAKDKKNGKNLVMPPFANESTPMFLEKENSFEIKRENESSNEPVVPPPPPGSPPPHLPQPKLKDPNKFIVNELLYFQYDLRRNEMLITPAPHVMPMLSQSMGIIPPPVIQQMPLPPPPIPSNVQQMQQMPTAPYPYKSNSGRHHSEQSESKSSKKSSRSSSSKHYHSSSSSSLSSTSSSSLHKSMQMHSSNDTNLIVLSSSPSNV